MGAALVLGEAVGWRRWLAIGCGLCRRPDHRPARLAGLQRLFAAGAGAASCFCAVRDLATRRLPRADALLACLHRDRLGGSRSAGSLGRADGRLERNGHRRMAEGVPPPPRSWWSATSSSSSPCESGDISSVAPFRYTALLWALLLGFLVFGDVPDAAMTLGAAIIVGSGLYTLYRERRAGAGVPPRPASRRWLPTASDGTIVPGP